MNLDFEANFAADHSAWELGSDTVSTAAIVTVWPKEITAMLRFLLPTCSQFLHAAEYC